MDDRLFTFVGGASGSWRVASSVTLAGAPPPALQALEVVSGGLRERPPGATWCLRGIRSNERYVTRTEKESLLAVQAPLGRPQATHAALIPIRKTAAWWALAQDERRRIFEENARHIEIGLRYLPAVARRLYHCRDLGADEPYDFLTWFEFAATDAPAFDTLLAALRASEEWAYVDAEVELRLVRSDA